jgi:AcrR family transcriptional regulator
MQPCPGTRSRPAHPAKVVYRRYVDTDGIRVARLTQTERKERTRAHLIATAHKAFLEHGFHGASLDEIAEEAGYSKGAVYSNFAGKDDLFLAVLDAYAERRARALADAIFDEERIEDSFRAVARSIVAADEGEPRWTPLVLEFWAHASRRPALRAEVAARRERFFTIVAGLIEELAARHGARLKIPAKEAARGSSALARGIALDRLLAPESVSSDLFEQMHIAYCNGLTEFAEDGRPTRKDTIAR